MDAAASCFAERGYAATTLPQIAARAGVSVESVAANGPKRDLLLAAFEQTFGGREGSDPMSERTEVSSLLDIPDRRAMVEAMADFIVAGQERGAGIWRALSAAADHDDTVAELYRGLAARRRQDHLLLVRALAERGMLRNERPLEEVADTLALLDGFDPYQLLVRDFGWPVDRLREWWMAMVERLVLRPEDPDPGDRGAGRTTR